MFGLLGGLIGGGKISKSILSTGLKVVDELYESDEEKKMSRSKVCSAIYFKRL